MKEKQFYFILEKQMAYTNLHLPLILCKFITINYVARGESPQFREF